MGQPWKWFSLHFLLRELTETYTQRKRKAGEELLSQFSRREGQHKITARRGMNDRIEGKEERTHTEHEDLLQWK